MDIDDCFYDRLMLLKVYGWGVVMMISFVYSACWTVGDQ
jgi:hypothetical protein